jgi:gamma-glutamyltranspeptidase/glutathione hydrolase
MSPLMVFDASGEPVLAIGSPGGSRIIDYVAKRDANWWSRVPS